MKRYTYKVTKINGDFEDTQALEKLAVHLNKRGEEGYRLFTTIPRIKEGVTESTVLVFEMETDRNDNITGG